MAVSNLDHLLSVVRIKQRPALPENLCKTTAQKLSMLYLVKILEKNLNYLTNRLDYQPMFLGMRLHACTKKTTGCMGYSGLSHYCLLKSTREHHKIFFLEKISKVFFVWHGIELQCRRRRILYLSTVVSSGISIIIN